MGQLLALHCLHAGDDVTIYDHNVQANCSHAASGMLAPMAELEKSQREIYEWGMEAIHTHWPAILQTLQTDIYFKQNGSLLLSHPSDEAEQQRVISAIMSKLAVHERPFVQTVEVSQLEPQLTKIKSGYLLQQEAQMDNQHLMSVLRSYLLAQGVQWREQFVETVSSGDVQVDGTHHHYDLVLDCRGLGAKKHFTTLRAVRGELIWLSAPAVKLTRPVRLLHPRYHLYIVPRPQQQYLLGASEIEAEDYSEISVQTTLELLTAAYYVHPGFAEARIIKNVTQCRPVFPNHLPVIEWQEGLMAVNGLYRHGFLIAPTLAHYMTQFIHHDGKRQSHENYFQSAGNGMQRGLQFANGVT